MTTIRTYVSEQQKIKWLLETMNDNKKVRQQQKIIREAQK